VKKVKKLLISLLTIVAVSGLVFGATRAYFTDQEVVDGNNFSAGEIDIEIRGEGATSQTFSDMAPGVWTDQVKYNIYNSANSLPVKYMFKAEKVSQTESGMYGKLNVKVRHAHAGTADPASWPTVYKGPLSDMAIRSPKHAISGTLGTNITHVYYMEFQLDSSVGNEYQGDSVVADFVFDATQTNNSGWTE
jgi:predicted ribosomally synthesized peptide with SipW-like signal peptide